MFGRVCSCLMGEEEANWFLRVLHQTKETWETRVSIDSAAHHHKPNSPIPQSPQTGRFPARCISSFLIRRLNNPMILYQPP